MTLADYFCRHTHPHTHRTDVITSSNVVGGSNKEVVLALHPVMITPCM